MTQMPQMVALFNGVGGGAAALVALLELHEIVDARGPTPAGSTWSRRRSRSLVGSVSFAGSVVTFAKLQELMTSRPVVFPGLPVVFGGCAGRRGRAVASLLVADPAMWLGHRARRWSACCSACCWCCPSAAPTCRS